MNKASKLLDKTQKEWFIKIYDIRSHETDRGFIIFVHSLLDLALHDLLVHYFVNVVSSDENILDKSRGKPTYWYKIMLCFRLGLISQNLKDDLLIIGKIRNKFAHDIDLNSLSHNDVDKKIDNLLKNSMEFVLENKELAAPSISSLPEKEQLLVLTLAGMFSSLYQKINRTDHLMPGYPEFVYPEDE